MEPPATHAVIEARGLTKRYGQRTVVDGLDLTVHEGEIFGLLGPNGAGKTTTILMLLGLTEPTAGVVRVLGHDPLREPLDVKRRVGYLPENVGFYDELTASENLLYTARLNGLDEREARAHVEALLEAVGLASAAHRRVREYSRGMRQRLGLADVLVKRPRIVILDEPTLGIDPKGVDEVLQLIAHLSQQERVTVLLSSHLLHQVQRICHRVGIFVGGRLIAQGPVESLARQLAGTAPLVVEVGVGPGQQSQAEHLVRTIDGVLDVTVNADGLVLSCRQDVRPEVARTLVTHGLSVQHLRLHTYGLDDIYRLYFQGGMQDGQRGPRSVVGGAA
ncbi:ABC transporter ATP-binding protein [Geochorda subterranea]|uniref:ABC transporter ATP-binding protein n=1 Tax=Geochorda subterranea TaxID=3109564 RepID=A0ABZ1BR90_9FIRM|nr:ABC transporter ATP-binding protein [Limnochorda sp. LNt]WRP15259.1 ABC transporter ATP-binding protein [Limnochorda sp. LNt]